MKKSELQQIIKEEIRKVLNESNAYKEVADILSKLHSYSNKIKFRVENVNGYENIIYTDENMLTKDLIQKLQSRSLWNTDFTPTTAKFNNKQVNITFDKSAQDILNIKDFDKRDWSPNM